MNMSRKKHSALDCMCIGIYCLSFIENETSVITYSMDMYWGVVPAYVATRKKNKCREKHGSKENDDEHI